MMSNVRMVETREGLRIDLVDQADFAMFRSGTDELSSEARALMKQVAEVTNFADNSVIVRGHTDAMPYSKGRTVNNWTLSAARAEATRRALSDFGVANTRFARIEGVADREPYVAGDPYDPRNRRMSITLAWSAADAPAEAGPVDLMAGGGASDPTAMPAAGLAQIAARKAGKQDGAP
jgi:chemotaxis protein MotB